MDKGGGGRFEDDGADCTGFDRFDWIPSSSSRRAPVALSSCDFDIRDSNSVFTGPDVSARVEINRELHYSPGRVVRSFGSIPPSPSP